jgi:NAD(P)H-dependent FMN reductase
VEELTRIVGISGSLRQASLNASLLRAAVGLMPAGSTLEVASITGIPLYNGDDEAASGVPPEAAALKEAVAGADGVILVTPEYNNGIPGVFKNAIDWMSRPSAEIPRVFRGRPFALMGASPGPHGTLLAQTAWLPILRTLGARVHEVRLLAAHAHDSFDATGALKDDALKSRLTRFLAEFVGAVSERR